MSTVFLKNDSLKGVITIKKQPNGKVYVVATVCQIGGDGLYIAAPLDEPEKSEKNHEREIGIFSDRESIAEAIKIINGI